MPQPKSWAAREGTVRVHKSTLFLLICCSLYGALSLGADIHDWCAIFC